MPTYFLPPKKRIGFDAFSSHEKNIDFWISIGADFSKPRSEKYFFDLLRKDISKYQEIVKKGKSTKEMDNLKKKSDKDIKEIVDRMGGTTDSLTNRSYNRAIAGREIFLYPPAVQETLKIFVNMFSIDIIPDPKDDKKEFGLWVKELYDMERAGGGKLQNALLRAKIDHDKKYDFEVSRPRHATKILKTAREQMEEEWDSISIPEEESVETIGKGDLIEL